jgi:hypothetical protein
VTGGSKDGYVHCALVCQFPAMYNMLYLVVHAQQGVDIVGLSVVVEAASGRLMPGCWLAGGCLWTDSWHVVGGLLVGC